MKLPWLQVAEEVFERAEGLADVLELESDDVVLGRLLKLWKAAIGWGDPNKPPDGVVKGTHAAQRIASAFRWKGPPDLLIEALVEFGFLEAIRGGFRVKGLGRYKSAFFRNKNLRPDGTARPPRGNRAGAASLDGDGERDLDQEPAVEEDRAYVAEDLPPPPPGTFEAPRARPPVQAPSPPTVQPVQDQEEGVRGLWRALEAASGAVFDTAPRDTIPTKAGPKLLAFWESHQRDTAWALDTQARWINRDRRWVANLNPPGATEVLLDDGQWPRFRRARPEPEPVAEEPHFAPAEPEPEVWGRVLALLREDGKNYALSWLDRIRATETSDAVVLHSPDRYFATWVSEHYAEMIRATLRELSETRELEIRSPEAVPPPLEDRPTQARAAA